MPGVARSGDLSAGCSFSPSLPAVTLLLELGLCCHKISQEQKVTLSRKWCSETRRNREHVDANPHHTSSELLLQSLTS